MPTKTGKRALYPDKTYRVKGWKIAAFIERLRRDGVIEHQSEFAKRLGIKEPKLAKICDRNRRVYDRKVACSLIKKIAKQMNCAWEQLTFDHRIFPFKDENHLWTILEQRGRHEYVVLQQVARKLSHEKRWQLADQVEKFLNEALQKCDDLNLRVYAFLEENGDPQLWDEIHALVNEIYDADDQCHLSLLAYEAEKTTFRQHLRAGDACLLYCRTAMRDKFPEKVLVPEAATELKKRIDEFIRPSLDYHRRLIEALRQEKMPAGNLWEPLMHHVTMLAKLVYPNSDAAQIFGPDQDESRDVPSTC